MKSIALIEGFSGGPLHTKNFRAKLREAGFDVVSKPSKADIIIAHSAACYSLPTHLKAELVVFIDPPYWPGITIFKRFRNNFKSTSRHDFKRFGRRYSLKKRLLQSLYTITRNKYLWLGIHNHKSLDFLDVPTMKIVIRNSDDSFCGPQIRDRAKEYMNVRYVEIPGIHDDYVVNPDPYIAVIKENL